MNDVDPDNPKDGDIIIRYMVDGYGNAVRPVAWWYHENSSWHDIFGPDERGGVGFKRAWMVWEYSDTNCRDKPVWHYAARGPELDDYHRAGKLVAKALKDQLPFATYASAHAEAVKRQKRHVKALASQLAEAEGHLAALVTQPTDGKIPAPPFTLHGRQARCCNCGNNPPEVKRINVRLDPTNCARHPPCSGWTHEVCAPCYEIIQESERREEQG